MNDVITHACAQCGSVFEKPHNARGQAASWCKPCRRRYMADWVSRNPSKIKQYTRNRPKPSRPPTPRCATCGEAKVIIGKACVNGCKQRHPAATRPVLRFATCTICADTFVLPLDARGSLTTCAGRKCQAIRSAQNRRWRDKRERQVGRSGGPRPYNDPDYKLAKAWLKANPDTTCWFPDCDAPATTIDHVPAIMEHQHVRGSGCCELRPACRPCNCSHGAAIGNRARDRERSSGYTW